jgi:hypothetical protein
VFFESIYKQSLLHFPVLAALRWACAHNSPLTPTRRGRSRTRLALVQPIPTLPGMAGLMTCINTARNRSAYG